MRILQINTVYPQGSTGKIAKGIHDLCINEGIECITAFRYTEKGKAIEHGHSVSSWLDCHIHNRLSSLTMLQGVFSYFRTRSFLRWVSRNAPDIIHLHNIHGSFINHSLLFAYIKKKKIPVVWTLHDCWAFTGHCPHFDMIGCNQWKTVCQNCPQKQNAWLDLSRFMHRQKKKWFSGVEHLHLAANSDWTAAQARQSYLGDHPIRTIYNGIDLSVFKPVVSDFAKQYGCEGKHIVLAVAFGWGEQKGLPEIPPDSFAKKLYSTYLSYLPKEKISCPLKMNEDARGSFTELLKTQKCGQFSVNISKPGITKGQHWHHTKWEFFIVVSGKGLIQQRRIGSEEILNFEVSGKRVEAVHMLPGYTHNIINLSETENLVTLMWANEPFDPDRPDTFFEVVE